MNRALLVGATGYLGSYITKVLVKRSYPVRVLAHNPDKLKQSGVRKFIYVSVLNGETLRHLKICDAKEVNK